jgi:hypothetical protein
MDNRPWHAGYFAEEGEQYEWENEDEEEDQDGTDRPGPDDLDIDDWDYNNEGQTTTAIVATHFSLYVAGSLIADMQRRLGVLPKNLGSGLEPIYGTNVLSPDILSVVVQSSESQLTNLGRRGVAPSRRPPPQGVSPGRSERATFYDTWGQLIELGIVVTSGIAAWEIAGRFGSPRPPSGGMKGGAFQTQTIWNQLKGAPIHKVAQKVVQDVVSEGEVRRSVADLIGTPEAIGLYNV